jgi:hypothetical protein
MMLRMSIDGSSYTLIELVILPYLWLEHEHPLVVNENCLVAQPNILPCSSNVCICDSSGKAGTYLHKSLCLLYY